MQPTKNLAQLLEIMAQLRNPDGGCPWDIEQDFFSIAPCTIEEAYEVVDAIEQGDKQALKEELGDLLLQVVFHAQMAKEEGSFDFHDIVEVLNDKLIRRHPHVFGDEEITSATAQEKAWEAQKEKERGAKGEAESVLDGVALGLPALLRAYKLQKRAARVGFDWRNAEEVFDKITEETNELKAELAAANKDEAAIEEELGDLLFAVSNLSRKLGFDPEMTLKKANQKFEKRFRFVEQDVVSNGKSVKESSLEEMEESWQRAKMIG